MTEYIKNKSGKIIGIVWDEQKGYGSVLVVSIVLVAVGATIFAWWKTKG